MIGTQIDSYRILDKLGEGGMGVVYKAVDTNLDRGVAIKVLSTDFSKNPDLVERFRAEARAQANLNHTNLATLYAFLLHEGTAYMVMELIDGQSFDQMIRNRGPIPEHEAVPLFRQALLGIGYAHRAGILHRDIKPNNLMLNKNGIVKVMDFGIAKVMGSRGLTKTGTQMGTVAYMSPEQIRNGPVDIRSDIYELGVTLYEMLSGHLPFESDSDFQIMQDHVASPPLPPSRHYPYISKGIENVILKSLAKNPDERFQTVEEFGAALEHPESLAPANTSEGTRVATPARGTVLETPSFAEKLASKTIGPAATIAFSATLPARVPAQTVAQTNASNTATGGSQKKWIIAGAVALLVVIGAVAGYRALTPVPSGGSGASSANIAPPSIKTALSDPTLAANSASASSSNPADVAGAALPPLNLDPPQPKSAPKPHALSSAEMLQHAQNAVAQQRYFDPVDNSALHWAILARKAGNSSAGAVESEIQAVYKKQMLGYYQQKNYPAALALLNGMLRYYPGNPSLLAERQRIQDAIASHAKR